MSLYRSRDWEAYVRFILAILTTAMTGGLAYAAPPQKDGTFHPEAMTEFARDAFWFNDMILTPVIIGVTGLVTVLLLWVIIRYNSKAHSKPSRWSHNTVLEIGWTLVPVAILIVIAAFSFPLLYKLDKEPDLSVIAASDQAEEAAAARQGWVTFKAMGNQWNWTYSFPDYVDEDGYAVEFVSNGLQKGGLSTDIPGGLHNLSVDYPLVLPVGRYIRYYTAASDVIHSFAMPSFAIKTDAIPGRLNEGWFKVDEPGIYYGQCSELCGKDHAFMPIEIHVVPQAQFDSWMAMMQAGDVDGAARSVAEIQPLTTPTRLASAAQ